MDTGMSRWMDVSTCVDACMHACMGNRQMKGWVDDMDGWIDG